VPPSTAGAERAKAPHHRPLLISSWGKDRGISGRYESDSRRKTARCHAAIYEFVLWLLVHPLAYLPERPPGDTRFDTIEARFEYVSFRTFGQKFYLSTLDWLRYEDIPTPAISQ
jgi:hypothetical protein